MRIQTSGQRSAIGLNQGRTRSGQWTGECGHFRLGRPVQRLLQSLLERTSQSDQIVTLIGHGLIRLASFGTV